MALPQEIDDYIKESIDYSLGLPVSTSTLEMKLRSSEESKIRLHDQCFCLQARLKEKDQIIERVRAESSMNAQALKKFVEENQNLAKECAHLLGQCRKLEKECSLYDHDREALMDFGNEADERAKEALIRVNEAEEELRRLSEEVLRYKHQCQLQQMDKSAECASKKEQCLLESLVSTLVGGDNVASSVHDFLEANSGVEVCQKLLNMWSSLRPSTQNVLALAAEVTTLQKDKEHLRVNLHRAEEEAKVLFEVNSILDEEHKRLKRQYQSEKKQLSSAGKKRKSSAKTCNSPIEKKIDFSDVDSPRQPLSPLQHNSPESRKLKK